MPHLFHYLYKTTNNNYTKFSFVFIYIENTTSGEKRHMFYQTYYYHPEPYYQPEPSKIVKAYLFDGIK